jgi:hypothetical protein
MSLHDDQHRCAQSFAAQVENDFPATVDRFLKQFSSTLSTELAYELCPEFCGNPHLQSFYRSALAGTAKLIVDKSWQRLLSTNPQNPFLFLIGGGPGTAPLTAARRTPAGLRNVASCIYDATNLSLTKTNNLIEECHRHGIPTIALYVSRPLELAASSFIRDSALDGIIPSAKEFALRHVNAYNTFTALVLRHRRKTFLFAPAIITSLPNEITCDANVRHFRKNEINFIIAESAFISTWNILQQSLTAKSTSETQPFKVRPHKAPKATKTLKNKAALAGYLLARTLESNLKAIREVRAFPFNTRPVAISPATLSEPPTKSLSHQLIHSSQAAAERITNWHEQTEIGRQQVEDRERPLRTVVREKKTHEHEMEIVHIR